MKNSLILFLTLTFVAAFSGCRESEYVYTSYYIYKNESSRDIEIESYYSAINGFLTTPESIFVIGIGDSHTLRFDAEGGYPYPFSWLQNPNETDYVIVSNGEKQFVHTRGSALRKEGWLYQQESYTITEDKNRNRDYQYIFTDKDFENAIPIEP